MDKKQNRATENPQGGGAVQPGSDCVAQLRSGGKPEGRGWGPYCAGAGWLRGGGALGLFSGEALGGAEH